MGLYTYLYLFAAGFVAGVVIAALTVRYNGIGRKRGFRKGRFYGSSREIDQRISEDIAAEQKKDVLNDPMEYHANKNFK